MDRFGKYCNMIKIISTTRNKYTILQICCSIFFSIIIIESIYPFKTSQINLVEQMRYKGITKNLNSLKKFYISKILNDLIK